MISSLPMPESLAVPLPNDVRLVVSVGESVRAGQRIASGDNADVLAPADGRVGEICRRPLADDKTQAQAQIVDCLALHETREATSLLVKNGTIEETLKKAGIVGLGGGAFPAWRKWRAQLQLFIANALESEPLASCDKALLAEGGEAAIIAVERVGRQFADKVILAITDKTQQRFSHPIIQIVEADYASGNERLLIERLTGVLPPAEIPPADAGIVCFNIGTVLAMDAALKDKTPMLGRVITVHNNGNAKNIRLPFGTSVEDIRRFLGTEISTAANVITPQTVVGAATIVLRFDEAPPLPAALPCIRCGACEPICPARLSPLLLYALGQDDRWEEMKKQRLPDCLECRRCDEVCPSRIPLAATFTAGKRQLAAQKAQQTLRERWHGRHERHLSQQQNSRHYLSGDALKSKIAARNPPSS